MHSLLLRRFFGLGVLAQDKWTTRCRLPFTVVGGGRCTNGTAFTLASLHRVPDTTGPEQAIRFHAPESD